MLKAFEYCIARGIGGSRVASLNVGARSGVLQMAIRAAPVWIVLGTGVACSTPAMAQTYDPNYPVCLQSYAHDGYIDCSNLDRPVQRDGLGTGRDMLR
jgi:hypothetical protein